METEANEFGVIFLHRSRTVSLHLYLNLKVQFSGEPAQTCFFVISNILSKCNWRVEHYKNFSHMVCSLLTVCNCRSIDSPALSSDCRPPSAEALHQQWRNHTSSFSLDQQELMLTNRAGRSRHMLQYSTVEWGSTRCPNPLDRHFHSRSLCPYYFRQTKDTKR